MSIQEEDITLPELYKIQKNKPYASTLKTLTTFWVYPRDLDKSYMMRFYLISATLIITSFGFCCFLSLLHLIMAKVEGRTTNISEDVSLIMAGTGLIASNATFSYRCRKWSTLLSKIAEFSELGDPLISQTTINRCNTYSKVFARYCFASTIVYGAAAYYQSFECVRINEEEGLQEICRTFMTVWLPVKLTTAGELVLFGLQTISAIIAVVPAVTVIFIHWESAELISLCFHHLKEFTKSLLLEKNVHKRHEKVHQWINHHQKILYITAELNETMKFSVGHLSLIAALVFACLINQATNYKVCGAVCELIGWLISIFLLCDAGQKVADSTQSISEAIYELEWYSTDLQTMKDILFIMMRAQKPMVLDALPLGTLNYTLYLMMLKGSYSFWTLLTQTAT